jgi:hypothetical protein
VLWEVLAEFYDLVIKVRVVYLTATFHLELLDAFVYSRVIPKKDK